MLEPLVVDSGDAIARAIDHVDEVLAAMGLAEPMRKRYLGAIAGFFQGTQRAREIGCFDEHVKILGVARDACISSEGVGAADQDVELRVLEHAQRVAVKGLGRRLENQLRLLDSGHSGRCVASDVPVADREPISTISTRRR